MGTNYYHHRDVCATCGRAGGVEHIGKSSAGWTFSFHGTEEIRSYEDWLSVLQGGGEIRDEYGRIIDLETFASMVECKQSASRRHYDFVKEHHPALMDDEWLDEEGHSFSGVEFS